MYSIDVVKSNNEYKELQSPTRNAVYDTAEEAVAAIPAADDNPYPALSLEDWQRDELLGKGCYEDSENIWAVTHVGELDAMNNDLSESERCEAAMSLLTDTEDYTDLISGIHSYMEPQYQMRATLFAMLRQAGGICKISPTFDADGYIAGYSLELAVESSLIETPLALSRHKKPATAQSEAAQLSEDL